MESITKITDYLNMLLNPDSFSDASFNGIQVESGREEIKKVAVAVDAGESVIEEAIENKADILIVHHGLYWGAELPAIGAHGRKLRKCMEGGLSVYASHLPLDGHQEIGNNALLAKHLGLTALEPFCEYKGSFLGTRGVSESRTKIEEFLAPLSELKGAIDPLVLDFGKNDIRTVGIVTGSASFAITLCKEEGIDLFITGEPKHSVYHEAKELEMNAIFAGHYATETVGVMELGRLLEENFDVTSFFIDQPTGI